jgi:hypothetical protein
MSDRRSGRRCHIFWNARDVGQWNVELRMMNGEWEEQPNACEDHFRNLHDNKVPGEPAPNPQFWGRLVILQIVILSPLVTHVPPELGARGWFARMSEM